MPLSHSCLVANVHLGSQPFGPLDLAVRPPVLIPRPETEDWTIRLAEALAPSALRPVSILDLCTGSGCIPILLCHLWPPGSVRAPGVDVNPAATQLAQQNAERSGIKIIPPRDSAPASPPASSQNNPSDHSDLEVGEKHEDRRRQGHNTFTAVVADLMDDDFLVRASLCSPYDLVTSNPPYIPQAEYERLSASVRDFEDPRALIGDSPDANFEMPEGDRSRGLVFYHRIATLVRDNRLLRPGGTLALEVGQGQADAVAAIVESKAGLDRIDIWKDPWGKDRVVVGRS